MMSPLILDLHGSRKISKNNQLEHIHIDLNDLIEYIDTLAKHTNIPQEKMIRLFVDMICQRDRRFRGTNYRNLAIPDYRKSYFPYDGPTRSQLPCSVTYTPLYDCMMQYLVGNASNYQTASQKEDIFINSSALELWQRTFISRTNETDPQECTANIFDSIDDDSNKFYVVQTDDNFVEFDSWQGVINELHRLKIVNLIWSGEGERGKIPKEFNWVDL